MRDEIFGRSWVENHDRFSKDVDATVSRLRGAAAGIALVFCKMAAIHFAAPWRDRGRTC